MEEVVFSAASPDPEDQYRSVGTVADVLESFIDSSDLPLREEAKTPLDCSAPA
ncbi:MAG: hypothetical protein N2C14_03870 [Planctomycetales bacterium]